MDRREAERRRDGRARRPSSVLDASRQPGSPAAAGRRWASGVGASASIGHPAACRRRHRRVAGAHRGLAAGDRAASGSSDARAAGAPDAAATRCCRPRRTSSARRSSRTDWGWRRAMWRSPGRARPSSRRCSTPCRTTCGPRWRRSVPPRGRCWTPSVAAEPEDRIASATAIDREAENLARLVANLLDLSRIEGGALSTDQEIYELDDLLERVARAAWASRWQAVR